MKRCQYLFLAALWFCSGSAHADQPICGKLFVQLTYDYSHCFTHLLVFDRWYDEKKSSMQTGSFWGLQTADGIALVTAAHVLGVNCQPAKLDDLVVDNKTVVLKTVAGRALLGTLAYVPAEVGLVMSLNDVAFLKPRDARMLQTIKALELSSTPPRNGELVRVVGYPRTPYLQISDANVTSVHEGQGFFILNKPVDGGYSGGVVLNASEQAYGVIVNTDATEKQTTVLRVTPAMLQAIKWQRAQDVLSRKF